MSLLPIKHYTPEEYLAIEGAAEFKHKYRTGEIFAMARAKRAHSLITTNTLVALANQLRDRDCEVYSNDMRVQGNQSREYSYPDVVVVCGQPQFRDSRPLRDVYSKVTLEAPVRLTLEGPR